MSAAELVDEPTPDPDAGHHRDLALDLISGVPEDEMSVADDIALAAVHALLSIDERLAAQGAPPGGDE